MRFLPIALLVPLLLVSGPTLAADPAAAKSGLVETFGLSERQAHAILDMRLQRLTGLERDKIVQEYAELKTTIAHLEAVLGSEAMVADIVVDELESLRDGYGDARRTEIVADLGDLTIEDLIAEEDMIITITHSGYIKRMPIDTYRRQGRGGRGIIGSDTKEGDFIQHLFIASTHEYILILTDRGRLYWLKVHEILCKPR